MIMWKNYILNLVTLLIWLQIHATHFIVFAIKQVVFVLPEGNARCAIFAVYFLRTMVWIICHWKNF